MGKKEKDSGGWEDSVKWDDYQEAAKAIVQRARDLTKAEVGVLFLTSDSIFLEAGYWESQDSERPSAAQLPTYRLDWWNKDHPEKLGGITAYVAVCGDVNLNQKEVFAHPAHRGKWDSVFLQGNPMKCKGILAVPVMNEGRLLGVLKVENPKQPDPLNNRFKGEHENALTDFARIIGRRLGDNANFWKQHVHSRAMQKVPLLIESLERGRSLEFNLSRSLSFLMNLFAVWLKRNQVAHVFWSESSQSCHVLGRCEATEIARIPSHQSVEKPGCETVIRWLQSIKAEVVQLNEPFPSDLHDPVFGAGCLNAQSASVDIIRLQAGEYDLGAIILPHGDISGQRSPKMSVEELETLTALAMNFVFTLGKFVEDEYETTRDTYLPDHRRPKVTKSCAILFADIRSFSTLTQIFRMTLNSQALESFVDHFCRITGQRIGAAKHGRVEKFLGDGVIGLFGEDLMAESDLKKVATALHCSLDMIRDFDALYHRWITEGLANDELPDGSLDQSKEPSFGAIGDLRQKYNERVEISLAIGINIGEVFFDYFGHGSHREYTAIGDHMNYTARLVDAASRFDESLRRTRSKILLSQTAHQYLSSAKCLVQRDPIWVQFHGFGYAYPVFELEPADVNMMALNAVISGS